MSKKKRRNVLFVTGVGTMLNKIFIDICEIFPLFVA
jgi:hypothetical protein